MHTLRRINTTIFIAALLITVSGCAGLKQSRDDILPFDPNVTKGTLNNGLSYFIRENHEPENRIVLRLFVNAGSVLEEDDQQGIAHLLEHMAFNGSDHFAANQLEEFLEAQGMEFGPDLNAYTTFDETVYQLELPADNPEAVEKAFLVLRDWATGLLLEDDAIDSERRVVQEEWRLRRGADARIRDTQIQELLKDSRYAARLPIGDMGVVMNTPAERIRDFYTKWYRPRLMAVAVAGDIATDLAEALIQAAFDYSTPSDPAARPDFNVPYPEENRELVITDPELTIGRAEIMSPLKPNFLISLKDYKRQIREILFWNMLNSRLEERTKDEDPPFLRAGGTNYRYLRPVELSYLSARGNGTTLLRSIKELLIEVRRVDLHGFTESEFKREKARVLKAIENAYLERENRSSSSIVREIGDYFFEGTAMPGIEYEYKLFMSEVPTISLEEVTSLKERFFPEKGSLICLSLPETGSNPTVEDIRQIRREVSVMDVPPYRENTIADTLVKDMPVPGSVTETRQFPGTGMTLLTLSNGMQIAFKQTDFDRNRVILRGFSPGGESLLPVEMLPAARTAVLIQKESGLGDFSAADLDKYLADKDAELASFINRYYEGFSGSSSSQDLKYLFQLLHLAFTAPRFDQNAFESVKTRVSASLADRDKSPQTLFSDTLNRLLTNGNPRRTPFTLETVEKMDLAESGQIYRQRFGNAGDFTLIIVGDTDISTVSTLAEQYLASLPATSLREAPEDNGVRPAALPVKETVKKGIEDQATEAIIFTRPKEWTERDAVLAGAFASVLDNILGEKIREEMGGTYSISAWSGLYKLPYQYAESGIYFGADPARLDELTEAILKTCSDLAVNGPEDRFVQNVEEAYLRNFEEQMKDNGFWAGFFETALKESRDPEDLLTPEEYAAIIDKESIMQTAAELLQPGDMIQVRLIPEN